MARILPEIKRRPLIRLLCDLMTVLFAVTLRPAAGRGEGEIRALNSSGNLNRPLTVDTGRNGDGYSAVLYDNRNGLPTSEANAVAQTGEGFLWIGSYAGLSRYDGNTFERIDSTTGIANVRCLYVDSRDRLWIGTNDAGVFLMSNGSFRKWDKSDGLGSASIRAISEDGDGVVYIGSAAGIAAVDADLRFAVLEDERIAGQMIRDLRLGADGMVWGLTQDGDLMALKDRAVVSFLGHEECHIPGILSMLPDPACPGRLYVGTEHARVFYGSMEQGLADAVSYDVAPLTYLERFEYFDGQIWICAGNGIGYLDGGEFSLLENVPMTSSVGHVMSDHEGSLWFTSTRQGVMKVVRNRFLDLFYRCGLPETVVNTTCLYGGQLFIGTDNGLIVLEDGKTADSVPLTKAVTASGAALDTADLLEFLDGVRIRSIIRDSRGRLWISTWRGHGLLRYDRGEVLAFTAEDGLFSEQTRMAFECGDGSIVSANTGGVNVIRDDRITASYGEKDGIAVTEILSVAEGPDHELILGTDGGGIYVIAPDGLRHIGMEDGLMSEVVLRVKRSRSGDFYWIVTGNSIAFMTPDYRVTTIKQFPYPNNYDIMENGRGDAWILSSAGIYVIPVEELKANGPVEPEYYGIRSGLPYIATTNSYSELTEDGDLYIAGMSGVISVNIDRPFEDISEIRAAIPFADADGERILPDETGVFIIPGGTHKLTVYPYVFSYSLIDPQISCRLEGFDETDTVVRRSDLDPMHYTNLPNGTYRFVMRISDPVGHVDKTMTFTIMKGREASAGMAGSIIVDIASLLFMLGILMYTSLFRKRGRLDDRLFFAMVLTNMALAFTDGLAYFLEGNAAPFVKQAMIMGNMVFYAAFALFPLLLLMYFVFRFDGDRDRVKGRWLLYAVPFILFVLLLGVNLATGWIFSIDGDCVYHSGPLNNIVFLPAGIYFLLALIRMYRHSVRLALLGVLLIAARIGLGVWFRDISSTAFTYTLFLICTHIYALNQPLSEETT